MNARVQRVCVWSGLVFMLVLLAGFVVSGFLPPPKPGDSALQIQAVFAGRQNRIKAGLILITLGSPLLFVFCAEISVQMKRIEGRFSPLSYAQLTCGGAGALLFLIPTLILQGIAYRPASHSPDLLLGLDDVAWIMFIGATTFALVQNLTIAVAIFGDSRVDPVFPRWAGYFNIWTGILFQPGLFIVFFTTGPLAWRNVFAFWMPLTVFGIWFAVMIWLLLRAIAAQERVAIAEVTGEPVLARQAA